MAKRNQDQINIALWTNTNNYRNNKEFYYKLKKDVPLPKNLDFDYSEHPRYNKSN